MLTGAGARLAPRAGVLAVVLLVAACTSTPTPTPSPSPSVDASLFGGTLRVGVLNLDFWEENYSTEEEFSIDDPAFDEWLDPQANPFVNGLQSLHRCCLLRTLVSHSGRSVAEGGGELIPDLAEALPDISSDASTWTFRLQRGIHYAPPMEEVEITSGDFVRALERTLRSRPPNPDDPEAIRPPIGDYFASFFAIVEGATAYSSGEADSVSGVQVPDPYTIEFTLSEPTGDFGDRLAFPAMAPIPPGASDGHDAGYGRFLVASGPYMVEGAEALDFSLAPEEQATPSGLGPGGSLTLVRNPSWERASDRLRTAFVDRIEFVNQPVDPETGGPDPEALEALERGDVDLLAGVANAQATQLAAPPASLRVEFGDGVGIAALPLNLARPPFDDVHVRRAMNLAISRAAVLTEFGGGGRVARHYTPDILTRGLLTDFDPYATPGDEGDLEAAMSEMALSRYDHDLDGICDDPVCSDLPAALWLGYPGIERVAAQVAEDLRAIGIDLALIPGGELTDDPETYPALVIGAAWSSDYPSPSAWFTPQAHSSGTERYTLIGTSVEQLAAWGYEVTDVPSVDDRIDRCQPLAGSVAVQCWAELEQYLLEEIVPWIPLVQGVAGYPVGDRVAVFRFDQVVAAPAYDKIVVAEP